MNKIFTLDFLKEYWIPIYAALALIIGILFKLIGIENLSDYVFISSLVIGGFPLIFETLKEFFKGKFNIDVIAIIAILGALFLGEYTAGAIIVLMLSGGEALESYAQQKAKSALKHLLKISPKVAHRLNGKNTEDVNVDDLKVNEHILIKPNEVIPIDCVIRKGNTMVDQSNLTGESVPVEKKEGDELLSGTLNQAGVIEAIVTKDSKNSAFGQIIKLIEDSEKSKAGINRLADQYGALFTPVVLIFAAIVFIISRNIDLTYAVFVIATPCPLLLATPIAVISGIGRAAKKGIIIKTGSALEAIGKADALIFDKTGTLTKGEAVVKEVKSLSSYSKDEIINYAAAVNQFSVHVLAHSIVNASNKDEVFKFDVMDYEDLLGKGVKGSVNKKTVYVGTLDLLKSNGIEVGDDIASILKEKHDDGFIVSFVSIEGKLAGYILMVDEVRDDAKKLVDELRHIGINDLVLATGDVKTVAEKIGTSVGIKEIYADSKPQDKVNIVKKFTDQGRVVAMIGDGVNDAPAMSIANVGIAMGARGSTIASEASDIVILTNNVDKVADAVIISKKAIVIAKQGIIVGMALSFIGMFFAAFGILPPVLGAIAQELIDIVAIFNALRVLGINTDKFKPTDLK